MQIPSEILCTQGQARRRARKVARALAEGTVVPTITLPDGAWVIVRGSVSAAHKEPAAFLGELGMALEETLDPSQGGWDKYLPVLNEVWGPLCFLTETYSFVKDRARILALVRALLRELDCYIGIGPRFYSIAVTGDFRFCYGILPNILKKAGVDIDKPFSNDNERFRSVLLEAERLLDTDNRR